MNAMRWLCMAAFATVSIGICGCHVLLLFFDPLCFGHIGENPQDYPDFDTNLAQLREEAEVSSCGCADYGYYLSTGTCTDSEIRYITKGDGFTGTSYYYRANGDFLALTDYTDFPIPPCFGSREWPVDVDCDQSTPTETICDGSDCPPE